MYIGQCYIFGPLLNAGEAASRLTGGRSSVPSHNAGRCVQCETDLSCAHHFHTRIIQFAACTSELIAVVRPRTDGNISRRQSLPEVAVRA